MHPLSLSLSFSISSTRARVLSLSLALSLSPSRGRSRESEAPRRWQGAQQGARPLSLACARALSLSLPLSLSPLLFLSLSLALRVALSRSQVGLLSGLAPRVGTSTLAGWTARCATPCACRCSSAACPLKITTCLDHFSHCKTVSGTNWLNRWTYRVLVMYTRRD